ncbi:hypothetical protein QVD17_17530 [Tagetes erecta]|uniref:Uncharacterized protein n=1 Tax=Tagetes erecta TaxID=13708 RepID=A0AAD8KX13_TARER|nr:hypothetical protein QVD17_17530 [Tagetes erecta]
MSGDNNNNLNHSISSLSDDLNTTDHTPIAYESSLTGSWDESSSSSFVTTMFKSELHSTETYNDDDEFIRQLTRQIEDYMLQEDDDDDNNGHNTHVECFHSHNSIPKVKDHNPNQRRVVVNSKRGRRWKMTESTQRVKCSRGGRARPMGCGHLASPGTGMRAVFFNRPDSKTGCNGTGVFLPSSANDPTVKTRKIPGYSAALVPTRVLEALEQHFNNLKSFSTTNNLLHIRPTHKGEEVACNKDCDGGRRHRSIDHVEEISHK